MRRLSIIFCLLFALAELYSDEPLQLKKKSKSVCKINATSFSKAAPDVSFIYPIWGYTINASIGYSNIVNSNLEGVWAPDGGIGYSFGAGYFRSLSPYFKLIAGMDISSISARIETGDYYEDLYIVEDIDNDEYQESIHVLSSENSSPFYFSIPVLLEVGNPNMDRLGFYLDLGVGFSFLLNSAYEKRGDYITNGTYSQFGDEELVLENVPELGFYGNLGDDETVRGTFNPTAELSKTNIVFHGGVGITIPISGNVIFKGGLVTHLGMTDIADSTPPPGSPEGTNPDNSPITEEVTYKRSKYIDNSFAVNEGSRTQYFGLEFGIYICRRLN